MKITHLLTAISALLVTSSLVRADDLEKIAGKWSVNRTSEQGQAVTQTIEIKKDKLTFKVVGSDGNTRLFAAGDVKLEKCGPFNVMKVTNIKAGESESEANPIEDDRTLVYQLGDNTWTIASNFDKEREQEPRVDVYKKVTK
jgi:hypothetical protein